MKKMSEYEKRGWNLLNEVSILDCEDEDAFCRHGEETSRSLAEFEGRAAAANGVWEVGRYFIDRAHAEKRAPRSQTADPGDLADLLETADLKNGVDIAEKGDALILVAYGQIYLDLTTDAHGTVTEVFECRLAG